VLPLLSVENICLAFILSDVFAGTEFKDANTPFLLLK
jgi:hypothetical protein